VLRRGEAAGMDAAELATGAGVDFGLLQAPNHH
jgi:hypothetical protein